MDRTRRQLLTASGALAAAALAGCAEDVDPTATPSGTPTDSQAPAEEAPPTGEPNAPNERLAELAAGNAAFALDLHRHLVDAEGDNLFVSPYSISVALAMTYAGARGETKAQMEEALHYTLGEDVHPALGELQSELERRGNGDDGDGEESEGVRLDVANALWGREEYDFDEDYLTLVEEHYGGGLRRADFVGDPEGERERINAWVEAQTEDRIQDLLPANSISARTVLVLTNAIYFLADWAEPFDPEETRDGTFTALDSTESTVPMMQRHLETPYASVPDAEAVELPYVGEDVSMVLILPAEGGFEDFERELDPDVLFGIFEALRSREGDVEMPRFEFESGFALADALSSLGMPGAFSASADFSGITAGDNSLAIDDVYHEAFVSVDEEGTEAAGATAVVMQDSAGPEQFHVRFDRPFLFCIRDRPTDAVLFLGRVADAEAISAD